MFWRKDFFRGPSPFDPHAKSAMRNPQFPSPRSKTHGLSVVGEKANFAGVLALLQSRCPSAVRRPSVLFALFALPARVMPIVVNALNGSLWKRFVPHIPKKGDKIPPPTVANRDSTPPVQVILAVSRVVATAFHLLPCRVLWRFVSTALSFPAASARLCAPITEAAAGNLGQLTAIATAEPDGLDADFGEFKHYQPAKPLAGHVFHAGLAPTRLRASITESRSNNRGRVAALAAAEPEGGAEAAHSSKFNYRQFSIDVAGFVFHVTGQLSRILNSHSSLLCRFGWIGPGGSCNLPPGPFRCVTLPDGRPAVNC